VANQLREILDTSTLCLILANSVPYKTGERPKLEQGSDRLETPLGLFGENTKFATFFLHVHLSRGMKFCIPGREM
jgi:hypothetical protein